MPKFWWPDLMVMILKDPRTLYTVAELMELTGERHSPNMSRVMRHMERLGLVSGEKFRGPQNHWYMKYRKLWTLERNQGGPVLREIADRTDPPIPFSEHQKV